jgi:hypothetical protein
MYWVDATATVLAGKDTMRRGSRRHRDHDYYLTLRWTDRTGRVLVVTRGVNRGLFFSMVGASPDARQIPVRYLPGRPDVPPVVTSDFVDTQNLPSGNAGPGISTQGTRLMSLFNNIPAGVRLFVTTRPLGPGGASSSTINANLISVDANGAGPANLVGATGAGSCASSREGPRVTRS